MGSFTYYESIPAAGDNPSDSQSEILQNFQSIGLASGSWVTQDHYGFGTGTDGQHQFIRFPANVTPGSAPTGLQAQIYTAPGSADPAKSQQYFKNSWGAMPTSLIKAFGFYDDTGVLQNGFNLAASITIAPPNYPITFTTNLPTASYGVFAFTLFQSTTGYFTDYRNVSTSGFTLTHTNTSTKTAFAVVVLQL